MKPHEPNYNNIPKSLLVLAVLSAVSQLASGEVAAKKDAELGAITVSAGRGAQLEDLDVSTTVMTREQIQQAPETSVEQIINKIPGVFALQRPAAQLHPTSQVFSIRGFGTTTNVNTLLMVDGVPVNDPFFRTMDWGQIPKDAIERIEVIRGGGATSLWGNMAMGGIINIVTRQPGASEKDFHISYGSFNTVTSDVSLGLALTDSLKIGATYDGVRSDGYNLTPAKYRNPNMVATEAQTDNLTLSAYFTPNRDSQYFLKFLAHRIEENGLVWNLAKNTWDTYRLSGGGSTKLSARSSINVNAWYGENEMDTRNTSLQKNGVSYTFDITNPGVGTPYVSQTEAAKYRNYGGSMFLLSEFGQIKDIQAGFDLRSISAKDPLNLFSLPNFNATITSRARHDFQGIFAQGTYRPKDIPLDITLGLREDFWQATDGSFNARGSKNNVPFASATVLSNQTFQHFDPRLGAKYYFSDSFDARAAAYRNFAAPGMNQMYRSFISGNSLTATNPQLAPQTNTGQEIGIDYIRPNYNLSLTFFNNKLKDFIDYATVQTNCNAGNNFCGTGINAINAGTVKQYVNAGDAVFRGYELLGNWQASESLQLTAGYTQTDAYLTSSKYTNASGGVIPDPTHEQIGQVPKWQATAGGTWQASPKLKLSLQLKSFPSYWNNTSHTTKNDGATIADLGATYRVDKALEVYGVVQNIGAAKYNDQGLSYKTTNGSTIDTSVIPAQGMPLNATVGVRVSF